MTDGPRHNPDYKNGVYFAHDGYQLWLRNDPNWHEPTAEVPMHSDTLLRLFEYAVLHGLMRRPH